VLRLTVIIHFYSIHKDLSAGNGPKFRGPLGPKYLILHKLLISSYIFDNFNII